jgi:hypothetical protein
MRLNGTVAVLLFAGGEAKGEEEEEEGEDGSPEGSSEAYASERLRMACSTGDGGGQEGRYDDAIAFRVSSSTVEWRWKSLEAAERSSNSDVK